MTQDKPKTGIGLTFLFGMLILLTASFGFALARKNGIIKEEERALAEKVDQLEEKIRVLTHSKEELEAVRSNLAAEIERLRFTLEQRSKGAEGTGNNK